MLYIQVVFQWFLLLQLVQEAVVAVVDLALALLEQTILVLQALAVAVLVEFLLD
jgi:hypothetical protein